MSDPAHPSITFRVNLSLFREEAVGPNTSVADVRMLHPDLYQNSADQGNVELSNRASTISTWLQGLQAGENRQLKDGDEFTVTGLKALYIRDNYASGFAPADRAWLEVV